MRKLLTIILMFPVVVYSQEKELSEYVLKCRETFKGMGEIFQEADISLENRCAEYEKTELAWISSGKPTIFVRRDSCEFMGMSGATADTCLPRAWPRKIEAIQIVAEPDAQIKLLTEVADAVRKSGINEVLISTSE